MCFFNYENQCMLIETSVCGRVWWSAFPLVGHPIMPDLFLHMSSGLGLSLLDTSQVDRVEDAGRGFRRCSARSGPHRCRTCGRRPDWRRREGADGSEHELDDVAVGFDEELQFRLDLHVNPVLTKLL